MKNTTRIAVPSESPGGLSAKRSGHFGRCDCFTLVDINEGRSFTATVIENVPHVEGGCLAPVNLLASQGVEAILVGGMGMRPLMGFRSAGIDVYLVQDGEDVRNAVEDFVAGRLEKMPEDAVCGGH